MSDEEGPRSWGSTQEFQREMREFSDTKLGGTHTVKTVFKKACAELREVGEAINAGAGDEEVAKEVADVALCLMLMGSLLERDIGILMRLKMAINEGRAFRLLADGTYQHIPGGGDAERVREGEGLDEVSPEAGEEAGVPVRSVPGKNQDRDRLF